MTEVNAHPELVKIYDGKISCRPGSTTLRVAITSGKAFPVNLDKQQLLDFSSLISYHTFEREILPKDVQETRDKIGLDLKEWPGVGKQQCGLLRVHKDDAFPWKHLNNHLCLNGKVPYVQLTNRTYLFLVPNQNSVDAANHRTAYCIFVQDYPRDVLSILDGCQSDQGLAHQSYHATSKTFNAFTSKSANDLYNNHNNALSPDNTMSRGTSLGSHHSASHGNTGANTAGQEELAQDVLGHDESPGISEPVHLQTNQSSSPAVNLDDVNHYVSRVTLCLSRFRTEMTVSDHLRRRAKMLLRKLPRFEDQIQKNSMFSTETLKHQLWSIVNSSPQSVDCSKSKVEQETEACIKSVVQDLTNWKSHNGTKDQILQCLAKHKREITTTRLHLEKELDEAIVRRNQGQGRQKNHFARLVNVYEEWLGKQLSEINKSQAYWHGLLGHNPSHDPKMHDIHEHIDKLCKDIMSKVNELFKICDGKRSQKRTWHSPQKTSLGRRQMQCGRASSTRPEHQQIQMNDDKKGHGVDHLSQKRHFANDDQAAKYVRFTENAGLQSRKSTTKSDHNQMKIPLSSRLPKEVHYEEFAHVSSRFSSENSSSCDEDLSDSECISYHPEPERKSSPEKNLFAEENAPTYSDGELLAEIPGKQNGNTYYLSSHPFTQSQESSTDSSPRLRIVVSSSSLDNTPDRNPSIQDNGHNAISPTKAPSSTAVQQKMEELMCKNLFPGHKWDSKKESPGKVQETHTGLVCAKSLRDKQERGNMGYRPSSVVSQINLHVYPIAPREQRVPSEYSIKRQNEVPSTSNNNLECGKTLGEKTIKRKNSECSAGNSHEGMEHVESSNVSKEDQTKSDRHKSTSKSVAKEKENKQRKQSDHKHSKQHNYKGHKVSSEGHRESPDEHKGTPEGDRSSSKVHKVSSEEHKATPEGLRSSKGHSQKGSSEEHKATPGDKTSSNGHKGFPEEHKGTSEGERRSSKGHKGSPEEHKGTSEGDKSSSKGHNGTPVGQKRSSKGHKGSSEEYKGTLEGQKMSSKGHKGSSVGHKRTSEGHKMSADGHKEAFKEQNVTSSEPNIKEKELRDQKEGNKDDIRITGGGYKSHEKKEKMNSNGKQVGSKQPKEQISQVSKKSEMQSKAQQILQSSSKEAQKSQPCSNTEGARSTGNASQPSDDKLSKTAGGEINAPVDKKRQGIVSKEHVKKEIDNSRHQAASVETSTKHKASASGRIEKTPKKQEPKNGEEEKHPKERECRGEGHSKDHNRKRKTQTSEKAVEEDTAEKKLKADIVSRNKTQTSKATPIKGTSTVKHGDVKKVLSDHKEKKSLSSQPSRRKISSTCSATEDKTDTKKQSEQNNNPISSKEKGKACDEVEKSNLNGCGAEQQEDNVHASQKEREFLIEIENKHGGSCIESPVVVIDDDSSSDEFSDESDLEDPLHRNILCTAEKSTKTSNNLVNESKERQELTREPDLKSKEQEIASPNAKMRRKHNDSRAHIQAGQGVPTGFQLVSRTASEASASSCSGAINTVLNTTLAQENDQLSCYDRTFVDKIVAQTIDAMAERYNLPFHKNASSLAQSKKSVEEGGTRQSQGKARGSPMAEPSEAVFRPSSLVNEQSHNIPDSYIHEHQRLPEPIVVMPEDLMGQETENLQLQECVQIPSGVQDVNDNSAANGAEVMSKPMLYNSQANVYGSCEFHLCNQTEAETSTPIVPNISNNYQHFHDPSGIADNIHTSPEFEFLDASGQSDNIMQYSYGQIVDSSASDPFTSCKQVNHPVHEGVSKRLHETRHWPECTGQTEICENNQMDDEPTFAVSQEIVCPPQPLVVIQNTYPPGVHAGFPQREGGHSMLHTGYSHQQQPAANGSIALTSTTTLPPHSSVTFTLGGSGSISFPPRSSPTAQVSTSLSESSMPRLSPVLGTVVLVKPMKDDEIEETEEDSVGGKAMAAVEKEETGEDSVDGKAMEAYEKGETGGGCGGGQSRKSRYFSKEAREVLLGWLNANINNPYPDHQTKEDLAARSGLTFSQVCKWLTASRKRNGLSRKRKHQKQNEDPNK